MTQPLRSSFLRRRSRLAQAATIAGSLALGTLVVHRLMEYFREDFFLYYGVSDRQYHELQQAARGELPLTLGQLTIAGIALAVVCWFLYSERRRLHQGTELDDACRCASREVVSSRMCRASMFDAFVTRTSAFAGILWVLWIAQSSTERWLGGFGWGLEYADWRSLLPLASVFGVCVFAGMLVALVSMFGLRAIQVLELVRALRARLRNRSERRPHPARTIASLRTFRELLGCDILSRPPPLAA
jgi:hypothetical protein